MFRYRAAANLVNRKKVRHKEITTQGGTIKEEEVASSSKESSDRLMLEGQKLFHLCGESDVLQEGSASSRLTPVGNRQIKKRQSKVGNQTT
jgi:hypothetical protein